MTNVLAPPLSQTLEHVYADGRVETLTFDEFIPAHEIDSRIADMAAYLTPLMIERPDDTVVAEIMSGATQTVDDVMIDVTKLAPNVKVKMVPLKISSYTGEE